MAERDESYLLDRGDSVGMTNEQYKGMLLAQLKSWKEVLELAVKAGSAEIQKKVEIEIATLEAQLQF